MKVIGGQASNFGSYAEFSFDFSVPGLHLISGATGAGKSTICDLTPWVLFGTTAKNGSANDIVSWQSTGDTKVDLDLKIHEHYVRIVRQRGKSNDLHFSVEKSVEKLGRNPVRGKDLKDTQRLLNAVLGFTADQYLASAYYHELSATAQFFSTTAANRRQTTEQLVDLSQVVKAQKGLSDALTASKKLLQELQANHNRTETSMILTDKNVERTLHQVRVWDLNQASKLTDLENKAFLFDSDKESKLDKINNDVELWEANNRATLFQLEKTIDIAKERRFNGASALAQLEAKKQAFKHAETCPTCGSKVDSAELEELSEDIVLAMHFLSEAAIKLEQYESSLAMQKTIKNPYLQQLEVMSASTNPYLGQLFSAISHEKNPHLQSLVDHQATAQRLTNELSETKMLISEEQDDQSLISTAKETADTVRQALIEASLREIEQETNRILNTNFDAGMRIEFIAQEFDRLDVNITKDGNDCKYTQLSKGQRQMLKLSFAISCMKTASNRSGIKFQQIFLDESLEGLDDALKVRSFSLLEDLSRDYNSIYVVDHNSDLKNMFTSRFEVTLSNGNSSIEKII